MNACTFDSCDSATGPVFMGEQVMFTEDFASNAKGWTLTGDWAIGAAVAGMTPDPSGGIDPGTDHTAGTADNGIAGTTIGGGITTGTHAAFYLTSPAINLTMAPVGSFVELRLWRYLNSDFAQYMTPTVEVSPDGTTWTKVWEKTQNVATIDSPPRGSGWYPMSFDVTQYKAAGFRVRVGYATVNGVFNMSGWSIDDVSIVSSPVKTDADQCTTLTCNPMQGATFAPLPTNDNDACTNDSCSNETGIVHAINYNDNNACTTDACNTMTGMQTHTPVNTNDNNACTTDACDSSNGNITHTPVNTNDNNACTTDSCDAMTGTISHTPLAGIDDGNGCTTDACNTMTGAITHTAVPNCCPHSACSVGILENTAGCSYAGTNNDCVTKVCAADSFCCTTAWDSYCVQEAKDSTICPTGIAGAPAFTCGCTHSYCTQGAALVAQCDPCVKKICEADSFCCGVGGGTWDSQCVDETSSICHMPAGTACK
jgi:hypothetical protein